MQLRFRFDGKTETRHFELNSLRKNKWQAFLSGEKTADLASGKTIDQVTVRYDDGMEVDVYLATADPTAYLNVVLYGPNGHPVRYAEPIVCLPADVRFEVDSCTYQLTVS